MKRRRRELAVMLMLLVCSVQILCAAVPVYKASSVRTYPHSTQAYTQGLFFQDGVLYESAGQYGSSFICKVDLHSGGSLAKASIERKYFAEGSCIFKGKLYVLTWREKVAMIYDPQTLKRLKTVSYPREGWGLTTDGNSLIASDGSSRLYFLDSSLRVTRTLVVKLNGRELRYLNELEWIDGKIWANLYTTDTIVLINPSSGEVESIIDCSGIYPKESRRPQDDVLNGIAADSEGRVFITGKLWPGLYEIRLDKVR